MFADFDPPQNIQLGANMPGNQKLEELVKNMIVLRLSPKSLALWEAVRARQMYTPVNFMLLSH